MVSTTIRISKQGLIPPVFLAGTFTDWRPNIEMENETSQPGSQSPPVFYKTIDLIPGVYQYKFRLGNGEWWITDEEAPKGDGLGSFNNVISISNASQDQTGDSKPRDDGDLFNAPCGDGTRSEALSQSRPSSNSATTSCGAEQESDNNSNDRLISDEYQTRAYNTIRYNRSMETMPQSRTSASEDMVEGNSVATNRQDPIAARQLSRREILSELLCCFSIKTAVTLAAVVLLIWRLS